MHLKKSIVNDVKRIIVDRLKVYVEIDLILTASSR